MRFQWLCLAAAIGATLPGCAGYTPAPLAYQQELNTPYRLDSGDKVRVTVFEQDTLTNTYAVDKGGYVSMPLIGSMAARGQTTSELEAAIAGRLRKGYLRDPNIAVEVDSYRPFFIMGEVAQGGQYSYVPGMTVQKAIAISGGFTPRAAQQNVDLTREVNGKIVSGRMSTSDAVLPGDTIFVRERWF